MLQKSIQYILCLLSSVCWVQSAFPPSLRYPLPIVMNKITDINETCDTGYFNITVALEQPFKGLIFAKDFSQECNVEGSFSSTLTISLPTSGCGVRLTTKTYEDGVIEMTYNVVLVIQQDKHLRQIADLERRIECMVGKNAFSVQSKTMQEVLRNDILGTEKNHRIGRMKDEGWSKELEGKPLEDELNDALAAARAWMEIIPEQDDERPLGTLQVGETALLTVKSTLPAGIGWKVIDCIAHDGLGDSSQKLLDENGCPIDELLLPRPAMGPIRPIALMRHQEAVSRFAAFKFPDRDRLHLSCGLQLCRGFCSTINCLNLNETNRLGRILDTNEKGEDGEVLDRLEVFNSVEVIAPEIDDLRKSERLRISDPPSTYPFSNLPGDRTFCVSPDKMAITFCILGVIFLCAVVVAACALLRARRSGQNVPYYTRSLFSSSSSGESGFGSKLLLHDSPCMSQSTSRGMQYGRIL